MRPDTLEDMRQIGRGQLSAPDDVDFDPERRLLVADSGNDRIVPDRVVAN